LVFVIFSKYYTYKKDRKEYYHSVAEPRGWLRVASATPGKIKNY
jgi:hypothetical protein